MKRLTDPRYTVAIRFMRGDLQWSTFAMGNNLRDTIRRARKMKRDVLARDRKAVR